MRDGITYDIELDRFRLNLDALAGCVVDGELIVSGDVVRELAQLTEAPDLRPQACPTDLGEEEGL